MDAGEAFLHSGGEHAHLGLDCAPHWLDDTAQPQRHNCQRHDGQQGHQSETCFFPKHGYDYAGRQQDYTGKLHHACARKAFSFGNVARGATHQIAGVGFVVKGKGQRLGGAEEVVAQGIGHAKGDPLAIVHVEEAGQAAQDGNTEDQSAGHKQGVGIVGVQPTIDRFLDDLGH